MFTRGSRRRRSERAAQDPERGRPCRVCRELCPGFQEHPWRKLCQHCKCPRGEHVGGAVSPALRGLLARLLPEPQPPPGSEGSGGAAEEFAWAPPGLSPEQVCQYFSLLPPALVPRLRSPGERHRLRELLRQLPPHDLEPQFCHDLDEAERRELKLFAQRRKRENLGQGSVRALPLSSEGAVCQQCGAAVRGGALAVFAARAGLGLCWHPRCFQCQQCQQPLVDLIYFCPGDSGGGRLLCGRHHGDSVRHRCPGCDELIFGGPCAEAGGRRWHLRHLRCLECEGALDPQTVPGGEGQPLCPPCRARRAHLCDTCGDPIGLQDPHVTHRGQHWHPLPGCFRCAPCGRPLLGRPFLPRGGQIFCSPRCAPGNHSDGTGNGNGSTGNGNGSTGNGNTGNGNGSTGNGNTGNGNSSPGPRSAPRRRSWGGAPPAGWQPRFRRGGPNRHSLPELGAAPRPSPHGPAPTGPAPNSHTPAGPSPHGPSPHRHSLPELGTAPRPSPTGPAPTGPAPNSHTPTGPSPHGPSPHRHSLPELGAAPRPSPTGPAPIGPTPNSHTPTGPSPHRHSLPELGTAPRPSPIGPAPTSPSPHGPNPTGPSPIGPAPTSPAPRYPSPSYPLPKSPSPHGPSPKSPSPPSPSPPRGSPPALRRGRGRARPRWPSSSSSSSSSSSWEGLFLGEPIPLPPQLRPPGASPDPAHQPRPRPRPRSRGCRLA